MSFSTPEEAEAERISSEIKAANRRIVDHQRATLGGLQKHSVGGTYPLVPVAYATGFDEVYWQAENLQTGQVFCAPDGTSKFAKVSAALALCVAATS